MREYLRVANQCDMDMLFDWANDPLVRNNSFSTAQITYEEHKKWFSNLLSRADCRQYIYVYDEVSVGQIRVSVCGDIAEIGYSICKEKRGMGYGKRMLKLLCEQVKKDFPQVRKLSAKVKPDNTASKKVFIDMGYKEQYIAFEMNIKNSL